ncbi:MAG: fibronectin type III domain-containing protein, partial [Ignavibacteria bacterium]|nr:fibronectin type III domain-containing protein [Ignavibacteria bacterium]
MYETTNNIEINYGNLNAGNHSFSYSTGISADVISSIPTPSELKLQQSANSTNFNNTPQNRLSTLPDANSRIQFTSTVSLPAASGTLSLSTITSNSMNLSWTDWCSNESAFAVYNSIDNINFSYVTKLSENSTSYSATNLNPATNYYWKLYALAEGYLSNPLENNATTSNANSKISNGSGSWKNPLIWTPNGVPTIGDNVTIDLNHTIIIDTNAVCNDLILLGTSTIFIGNNTFSRNLLIRKDLLINSAARLEVNVFDAIHTINVNGNLTNNGMLNLYKTVSRNAITTFNIAGNKTISGTGSNTIFGKITVDMG